MSAAPFQEIAQDDEPIIDQLPADVVERLPDDIVEQLRDGSLDQIPEDLVERLPVSVQDRIPDGLIDAASDNIGFAVVLAVVGGLAVLGFFWGVSKSAMKAALFFAAVAVGAWIWFFAQ